MGLFSKDVPDAPGPVEMKSGKSLACVVCGGERFHKREAVLATPGMTLVELNWANSVAQCRVCADCGYIFWFLAGK